jgi:hypothetical protein
MGMLNAALVVAVAADCKQMPTSLVSDQPSSRGCGRSSVFRMLMWPFSFSLGRLPQAPETPVQA